MCKRGDEFYCSFGEEPNCKYGKNAYAGECDYKDENSRIVCNCKEAIEEAKGQPKRTPLPDGTLSLTDEELEEFGIVS